ncbi:hypothetical protein SAMN05421788_103468 [Filimonas lacunae]|uniref:Chaperone of endosialidase n=1 Tax=Filimonas lacunae TaxID=477680 RepID=A0A173MKG1_9BACT|nr:hypothetical protein [Filimonas lacunae]BAV08132.1 hypothetical protein FLA_4165 [Filimonas lacunae]SIT09751.1 hypothetical protein SAMN05421788_103468 [Filimonas lacunae]
MKKLYLVLAAAIAPWLPAISQTEQPTLQSVTTNGSITTNPININKAVITTAANAVSPILTLRPEYNRVGAVTMILDATYPNAAVGTYSVSPTNVTGTGTGLVISLTITAGALAGKATIVNGGSGYRVSDVVNVPITLVGGTIAGSFNLFITDVSGANLYDIKNAPLAITPGVNEWGFENAYMPVYQLKTLFRNDTQASENALSFGYAWRNSQKAYWAFKLDTNYIMGMDSGVVDMPLLSSSRGTFQTTASGGIGATGSMVNVGQFNQSFVDNVFREYGYNDTTGSSFVSRQNIIPGTIGDVTLVNTGSNYRIGRYTNVPATGGSGTNLFLDITVGQDGKVFGVVVSAEKPNAGTGYVDGDYVRADLPGGAGFIASVTTNKGNNSFAALSNSSIYKSKTADSFYTVRSVPIINQVTGATGNVFGFYHNPNLLNLQGKNIAFHNVTGDVYFSTKSGNVGIGTTNPTQKLSVNGTMLGQRIKITELSADWPDYVFAASYKKWSVEKIAAFIKMNGHLPEVPDAATAAVDGVDLGDNTAVLLKKIEELTLLMIEQNKLMAQQAKQLAVLEKEKN